MNMNSLNDFIKQLRKEAKAWDSSGRRPLRAGDSAKGLEYNEMNATYRVCKKLWSADIARTPQVVKGFGDRTDVHGEAQAVNRYNNMINYRDQRAKGRGR